MNEIKATRTLIAIPCMDMVQTSFMKSMLGLMRVGETQVAITVSSLIYDARNNLAAQAINEGYDRILWLDSDMVFKPDLLVKLARDMDEGREYVSAIYFKRKPPFTPTFYKDLIYSHDKEKNELNITLNSYMDYPKDTIFPIAGSGMAGTLMAVDLIKKVGAAFGHPFSPMLGMGEDISFCWRVQQLGVEMYCDSRVKMGHVGLATFNEDTFLSTRGNDNAG